MARNDPVVSICIPAYNGDKFLAETLWSISGQTFSDWEVIVTEDGSRDGTEAIVNAFAATVTQGVIYNRHPKNCGLPAARNTGIAAARGRWVAFLDADDVWRPQHLEKLLEVAQKNDADLAFAGTVPFDDESGTALTPCVPCDEDLDTLPVAVFTGRLSILPSSVLVNRRAFEAFGTISTDFPHANDTEYWLRVLRGGGRVVYSGEATCLYRKHSNAMSLRAWRILTNTAEICERYSDWDAIPRWVARRRVSSLYRYAARATLHIDLGRAVTLMKRSVKVSPLSSYSWFYLVVISLRATWMTLMFPRKSATLAART